MLLRFQDHHCVPNSELLDGIPGPDTLQFRRAVFGLAERNAAREAHPNPRTNTDRVRQFKSKPD
jgi:hypothetical protein